MTNEQLKERVLELAKDSWHSELADLERSFNFVFDVMYEYMEQIKENEPYATVTIQQYHKALNVVADVRDECVADLLKEEDFE